jgi:hypothetical protein
VTAPRLMFYTLQRTEAYIILNPNKINQFSKCTDCTILFIDIIKKNRKTPLNAVKVAEVVDK